MHHRCLMHPPLLRSPHSTTNHCAELSWATHAPKSLSHALSPAPSPTWAEASSPSFSDVPMQLSMPGMRCANLSRSVGSSRACVCMGDGILGRGKGHDVRAPVLAHLPCVGSSLCWLQPDACVGSSPLPA